MPAKYSCLFPFTHALSSFNRICASMESTWAVIWPPGNFVHPPFSLFSMILICFLPFFSLRLNHSCLYLFICNGKWWYSLLQVGQLTFHERQELLKKHYSFKCQCRGCSELSLSDIVISAFCCYVPNCVGAVLDVDQHKELEEAFPHESTSSFNCICSLPVSFISCVQAKKKTSLWWK